MEMSANELKNGSKLEYEGEVWVIIKNPVHTKPGKGGAYVQVEMKNLFNGTKVNKRFSSSERFVKPYFEQIEMQYLYSEDNKLVMMNPVNFEQILIDSSILGEQLPFLQDGMSVKIEFYKEQAVFVDLPANVIVEIAETDPVIKGSTVTSSFKPAILTNGVKVMVPPYLVTGEKIIVKTEDATFVKRAE